MFCDSPDSATDDEFLKANEEFEEVLAVSTPDSPVPNNRPSTSTWMNTGTMGGVLGSTYRNCVLIFWIQISFEQCTFGSRFSYS